MRIEELILEGFKSYPVRTQITGWDPSFNAITGLNGSGKSNILDAICFVLGITNMGAMRAANQQDLIYKRGQAGVTKASVTIVFDNSDREKSPIGLENYKQITVTRQIALPNISKYLLNGHKSQQNTIQTLFQSVQLNINNPNFLIMQGRITKVLNMRPQEILGMVEEAAGTRMFEERKDKAKKTMSKKEKRVQEITTLLDEEITPKLDKLRAEKRAYLQYQKVATELERVGRLLRAWEYTDGCARVEKKQAEMEEARTRKGAVQAARRALEADIEAAEGGIHEVEKQREKEMKKGGRYKKLEAEVDELDKLVEKVKTQVEIKQSTIKEDERRVAEAGQEAEENDRALAAKEAELEDFKKAHAVVAEQLATNTAKKENDEALLQSLLTGLGDRGGRGGGYMGQLENARLRVSQALAEEEQGKTKLSMAEKELKALETRWKTVEREAGEGKRNLEKMQKEVEAARKKVQQCGWDQEKHGKAEAEHRAAKDAEGKALADRDRSTQNMPGLHFDYTPPTPNWDRSKVKGLVASLISLKKEDYNKATALEITAGARLYNVVVEDEKIGKDLLNKGQLKKRVTIIPLNKINNTIMTAKKLGAARDLAPGKVDLALQLVGFPRDVTNAMNFVFGDTLICEDAATAKLVTFHPSVGGARSVTLEGDVYDPSGTLSGGSAPQSNGTLVSAQRVQEAERALRAARDHVQAVQREEEKTRTVREQWKQLSRELELKEHEMKLQEEQLSGSNASRLSTEIEEKKVHIGKLKDAVQTAKDKQKAGNDEVKQLEKDMEEFKDNKEGKIDELKASIQKQKTALQKLNVVHKTKQKDMQTAQAELDSLQADKQGNIDGVAEAKAGVEKSREELEVLKAELAKQRDAHATANQKLQEERATLVRFDNELRELQAVIKAKKEKIADADVELTKLEHDVQNLEKERVQANKQVENLVKLNPWIDEEKASFGKKGGAFDFTGSNIKDLRKQAEKMETEQKNMKKKVNERAMGVIEEVEKREKQLNKMLGTVMKDKEKIEETIEELDRYKRDALQTTWEKVNGDFGGIFAELLPGNFAKLQPPDGQDLTQGLEVKVQLGSVWKQSLTELSGGQRSLIALSLIMSLLQFKPAPMYILDEIDAALDLSHTQHIGQLFRTRFKGSQFIVVSLKEGLFTNANVLFRTRFRDGTSVVERTAQRSTSTLYDKENDGDEGVRGGRRGARS